MNISDLDNKHSVIHKKFRKILNEKWVNWQAGRTFDWLPQLWWKDTLLVKTIAQKILHLSFKNCGLAH